MKKSLLGLVAASLMLGSCTDETDGTSRLPQCKNVITASFEQGVSGGRVALVPDDNNGNLGLAWTAGDAFSLFHQAGNGVERIVFVLNQESDGQQQGVFETEESISGSIQAIGAAYPNDYASWDNGKLVITMPSEITFDASAQNNCNLPMWGVLSEGNQMSFKHLGSLLRVNFSNMPAGYDRLVVKASSPICGKFNVLVNNDVPVLSGYMDSQDYESLNEVRVNFEPGTENTDQMLFYIPLPAGTYSSLSVGIGKSTDENAYLTLRSWTNISFERAKFYTASVAYAEVTEASVSAVNRVLEEFISSESENTTAQLVMTEAIVNPTEAINIPNNATNVSLEFTAVTGTSPDSPLTITSDTESASTDTKTLSLNIPTTDSDGSCVSVSTPTTTVDLTGGKFAQITAATASNTLIVGDGVEITGLIIKQGNVRIKKGGIIEKISYTGETGFIYVILEEGATAPTTIEGENITVITAIEYDLANMANGAIYNLTSNMILDSPLYIANDVTVELNGYRITHCGENFKDPKGDKALVVVKRGGTFKVNNHNGDGRITVLKDGWQNNLNIHAAIKMTAAGESETGETATLILNNGYIEGNYYSITGNGNRHDTYVEINGGWISSLGGEGHRDLGSETLGIYHPQNGKIVINGGTIKGYESAIEMRGGELEVNGGNFEVEPVTTEFSTRPNSNGNTVIGAALAVSPHQGRNVTVTVNSGSFTGPMAIYEEYMYEDEVPVITLRLDNLSCTGNIFSENCTAFISGGSFSVEPDDAYKAADYNGNAGGGSGDNPGGNTGGSGGEITSGVNNGSTGGNDFGNGGVF